MVGENAYLLLEAGMIADYLEQKRIIKLGDLDWKNDFLFGMILPKLKKEAFDKAFENPFYQVNDKKRELEWYARRFVGKFIQRPYWMLLTRKNIRENGLGFIVMSKTKRRIQIIMSYIAAPFVGDDVRAKIWIFEKWKKKWNESYDGNKYQYFTQLFEYD